MKFSHFCCIQHNIFKDSHQLLLLFCVFRALHAIALAACKTFWHRQAQARHKSFPLSVLPLSVLSAPNIQPHIPHNTEFNVMEINFSLEMPAWLHVFVQVFKTKHKKALRVKMILVQVSAVDNHSADRWSDHSTQHSPWTGECGDIYNRTSHGRDFRGSGVHPHAAVPEIWQHRLRLIPWTCILSKILLFPQVKFYSEVLLKDQQVEMLISAIHVPSIDVFLRTFGLSYTVKREYYQE